MGGLRTLGFALGIAVAGLWSAPGAFASGAGEPAPWYIDPYGGDRADLESFYNGRVGVVMANAPKPMLFVSWRLLHDRKVGVAAGEALSVPCCGQGGLDTFDATQGWLKARMEVPGAKPIDSIQAERRIEDPYMVTANCFSEAFGLAGETLADRAKRYGASSAAVKAWLETQDGVFTACGDPAATLPPVLASAPAWLSQDRAYQEAAFSLYMGRNREAADRFAAIARQSGSPWASRGLYLAARAELRQALQDKTAASWSRVEAAVDRLAKAPAGTFGQGEARGLRNVAAARSRPDAYLVELARRLDQPQLAADAAVDFRDLSTLGSSRPNPPEAVDWMITLKGLYGVKPEDAESQDSRRASLAHAKARWAVSRDNAWLIAALSLVNPGEADAAALARDAGQVKETDPAFISAQYHLTRLTLAQASADQTRGKLDRLLARTDLSVSDRNLFRAQRTQVAADLADFLRYAQRTRICADEWSSTEDKTMRCVRWRWGSSFYQARGVYDQEAEMGTTGFGDDARAIIDRMPLATRLAISADAKLPRALRLDVALTSFGRAVGAQNDARIDEAAKQLTTLLPLMAADFRAVVAAKPGPDKRFAEFLVLSKIPGVRPDLGDRYVRPEGKSVSDFQERWSDWVLAKDATANAPRLVDYQMDGYVDYDAPDPLTDLSCLGDCHRGSSPLVLPAFVTAQQAAAQAERRGFTLDTHDEEGKLDPKLASGVALWDEMLTYAAAHRADPRVPEALYWLVRVGRFGGSHNHSGKRAFQLLKARYPQSDWAKRTPYYYD